MTWSEVFQSTRHRWALAFCVVMALVTFLYMPTYYQEVIQPKPGTYPWDPLLARLTPLDWSIPIFIILYLSVIQTLGMSYRKPSILLSGLTTYCAVNLLRMATMYTITFEPPQDMILLIDPIASFIVYPDNTFAKDLFFSGHVSTMMVLMLVEENPWATRLKAAGTFLVGLFLAWQHVHYTLDLVVAPFVTYGLYRIISMWLEPLPVTEADLDIRTPAKNPLGR